MKLSTDSKDLPKTEDRDIKKEVSYEDSPKVIICESTVKDGTGLRAITKYSAMPDSKCPFDKGTMDDIETNWLHTYPVFNPEFTTKSKDENCLTYALYITSSSPRLYNFGSYSHSQQQLDYVTTEINNHYDDTTLAMVAPHETGKLPPPKQDYYIASFHYSCEQDKIQVNGREYCQLQDFHFLVQNNDGAFSHRRGQKGIPERTDSNGNQIQLPELTTLFYVFPAGVPFCTDYRFVGYIYLKINKTPCEPSTKSIGIQEEIEEKASDDSGLQNKLTQFKGGFFMKPQLPESPSSCDLAKTNRQLCFL